MMLDRRLHAFRPDLAEAGLEGRVEALRFVSGTGARIGSPVVALRPRPDAGCGIDTELLQGEAVTVFERTDDGWAWVKAVEDGYVGYLPQASLVEGGDEPGHRICVPRTFVYPAPDLRSPAVAALSMGSRVAVVGEAETRGTRYALLAGGGAVIAAHCLAIGGAAGDDPVAVAARFLETPYLWGGRSGFGLDCSGLVQLSMMMTGRRVPRDTDMQQASPAEDLERGDLRRGDLVFWKGHVGFMEDETTLLHANGHTMTVARENLDHAIDRIGWLYQRPTAFGRLLF